MTHDPTNPRGLTGLEYITWKASQSEPSLPSEPLALEEPQTLVSAEDIAALMGSPLDSGPSLTPPVPPNFKHKQFIAFSTPLIVAYWQGLPELTMGELKALTLEAATPLLKVRKLGWKALGNLDPSNQAALLSVYETLKARPGLLYSDKAKHIAMVRELAFLELPVVAEKTMSRVFASKVLEDWISGVIDHCALEGLENPRDGLVKQTPSMNLLSPEDFEAAWDLL